MGGPHRQVDVTWVSSSAGVDVFEFRGPVVVWFVEGNGLKANRLMACNGRVTHPNLVTATVTR